MTDETKRKGSRLSRLATIYLIGLAGVLWMRGCFATNVNVGRVGVRQNSFSGIHESDLEPGLHWEILGMHEIYELPRN